MLLHLVCNYRAVRALGMPMFNLHRLLHVARAFADGSAAVPAVAAGNAAEPVFPCRRMSMERANGERSREREREKKKKKKRDSRRSRRVS